MDLSKVFHTVNWETLWEALRRQNISNQSIWILQCLDHNQTGVVRDGAGDSRTFDIFSSVREGCALTPRLFCAAFELAMSEWRLANPHGRVDLGDVMPRLLDLRFAGDIFIFLKTKEEAQKLLDNLVQHLATAGLVLNSSKTMALTTEAQPPSFIQVGDSHVIKVLGYSESHKCACCALPWSGLRCRMPFATGSQGFPETPLDVTMQRLFYQTSTALFRSSCFFNSLLRCRAPTIIQKTFEEV